MNNGRVIAAALVATIGACTPQHGSQEATNDAKAPALPAQESVPPGSGAAAPAPAPASPAASAPARAPAAREAASDAPQTSLAEPRGPIDPRSVEAAGQVVQLYAAHLEAGQLDKAARQWGDPNAASAFARQVGPNTHVQIGDLGPTEGAAGSIYTTVPVTFVHGNKRRAADVFLRRVNDVPGSTEAQRRWHIERIEWSKAG